MIMTNFRGKHPFGNTQLSAAKGIAYSERESIAAKQSTMVSVFRVPRCRNLLISCP